MPIQWKDPDVMERLLAAMLAAVDNKVNINEIARLYGGDMTYNALENHLRRFKKEAIKMKTIAERMTGLTPKAARPKCLKTVPATPTANGVLSGRVTKNVPPKLKVKCKHLDEKLPFEKRNRGKDIDNNDEIEI